MPGKYLFSIPFIVKYINYSKHKTHTCSTYLSKIIEPGGQCDFDRCAPIIVKPQMEVGQVLVI